MASVSRRTLRCSADNRPSRARRLRPCPSLVGWLGERVAVTARPGVGNHFHISVRRIDGTPPVCIPSPRRSATSLAASGPVVNPQSPTIVARGVGYHPPSPRVCVRARDKRAIKRWAFGPRGAARHQAPRRSKFRGGRPPAHPAGRQNGLWSPTRIVGGRLKSGTGATGLEPATSGVTGRRSNQLNYAPERRRIVAGA